MPLPTPVAAVAFKPVLVEIMRAVARQAGKGAIVEGKLKHIGIAAVAIEIEHALRPEDERHRCASLGIGGVVGEIVIPGESLVGSRGAEAGGDIHALAGNVLPQNLAGA